MALRDGVTLICSSGKSLCISFGASADVDIDAKIEAPRAFEFVPDQQRDLARCPSMDQDLVGRNHERICHRGIGDRNSLQRFRWY